MAAAVYDIGSGVTIAIELVTPADETIDLTSTAGAQITQSDMIDVTVTQPFDSCLWVLDGWDQEEQSQTIAIDCGPLSLGTHYLTAIVGKNGALYSKQLIFIVELQETSE